MDWSEINEISLFFCLNWNICKRTIESCWFIELAKYLHLTLQCETYKMFPIFQVFHKESVLLSFRPETFSQECKNFYDSSNRTVTKENLAKGV